jgi:lysozyme
VFDLSNNNGPGHDFRAAFAAGERRCYLKLTEGTGFVDPLYHTFRVQALAAGFHAGAYSFLHALESTPGEAADYLIARVPNPFRPAHDLRPAIDLESFRGGPAASPKVGRWTSALAARIESTLGFKPVVYGSADYLQRCGFVTLPGPLWLAYYGPHDNGTLHAPPRLPAPWSAMAAQQFTSVGTVHGIHGPVDRSWVFHGALLAVPPPGV